MMSVLSIPPPVRCWRRERLPIAVIFAVVFALYAYTAPRYVALEDDALFIGNLHFWGVAHPPGYPAYTVIGGIFYHLLPFLSPALKAHLFSGFAGAATCCAVYAVVAMLRRERVFAVAAALLFAVSKSFWSQAIIAEVYTLNAFFFFTLLAFCIACANAEEGNARRWFYCAAVIFGVGLANHYPLLLLGCVGLPFIVAAQCRRRPLRWVFGAVVSLAVAAPFYLFMWRRSHAYIDYNFFGTIKNFDGFLHYFSRGPYQGDDSSVIVDADDKIAYVEFLGGEMFGQFTPIGLFFVVLGFFSLLGGGSYRLGAVLFLGFFCSSFLLVFLSDFNADPTSFSIFRVYPLIAYGIMAIWLSLGLAAVYDGVGRMRRSLNKPLSIVGVYAVLLLLVLAPATAHWRENNRRDYRWAHDLSMARLNALPANAILFAYGDLDFPLGYLHYVEGVRPDIEIYSSLGTIYRNRLYSLLLDKKSKATVVRNFIRERLRAVHYNPLLREFFDDAHPQSDFFGFFRRIHKEDRANRILLSDDSLRWVNETLEQAPSTDVWSRHQRRAILSQLVTAAYYAKLKGASIGAQWQAAIETTRADEPLIRLITDKHALEEGRMSEDDMRRALEWNEQWDLRGADLFDEGANSIYYTVRALLIAGLRGEDDAEYELTLRAALAEKKESDNPALPLALAYYAKKEDACALQATLRRFYQEADDLPTEWRNAPKAENCP